MMSVVPARICLLYTSHINSILQPATATDAPVVGVAITTETMVAGCATGATHPTDLEETARFVIEAAKYLSLIHI